MKYSQAGLGRIFVLRLEDGEIVHEVIEGFAREQSIRSAALIILGGADQGSTLIAGPEKGRAIPVTPVEIVLAGVHEITGTGTIFPDEDGNPLLHMHIACGRGSDTRAGCIRRGVKVWHIMEVILFELIDTDCRRILELKTGFKLLQPR